MAIIIRTASSYLKVAAIFMCLGLVLFVIGFSTKGWADSNDLGLWYQYFRPSSYAKAIQAMECLGLIGYCLAILALLFYFCLDQARRRDFLQAAAGFTFAGLVFASIGLALAGYHHRENSFWNGGRIGWSFGLCIAGSCAYGVSLIMLVVQLMGC